MDRSIRRCLVTAMSPSDGFELVPRSGERRILAGNEAWSVYESRAPNTDNGPSLIFESMKIVRRIRDYPADWRALNDQDLYALSCAAHDG